MMTDIASLRLDYAARTLDEKEVDRNPYLQFDSWFQQALEAQLREPNAMTLATASPDGVPSARIVLLKAVDAGGFVFFTNYASAKGRELERNPRVALVFFWNELERQVRIEGTVAKVSRAESEAYFASRPLKSRFGAAASPQSEVVPGREWLESRMQELEDRMGEEGPPCPADWGGYRVDPGRIELWQGRRSRLHDRVVYVRAEGEWRISRLAP
jgi:pyridoxamine 5'-phosphate oxidase